MKKKNTVEEDHIDLLPPSSNLFLNFQKYKDQVPRWVPGFRSKFVSWTFLCFRSNPNFGIFEESEPVYRDWYLAAFELWYLV